MNCISLASLRNAPLVLAIALAPALGAQGLTYDMRTSANMTDPRTGAQTTRTFMSGHGQFTNGLSRIDVVESMSPQGAMMGAGTYMIASTAKGTTTMVDPAKRTYMELNPAELAKTSAGLQQSLGGLAKIDVSDVAVNVEDLGAGEPIEGYSTLKYRITESYTMTMTIMGHNTVSKQNSTTDVWVAPQLDGIMDPISRPAATQGTGPMAALTTPLSAAYAKLRKGAMLKRVMTDASVRDGKSRSTVVTMTISNVKRGSISPSVFVVPSGYTKAASPFEALAPVGAASESLRAAHRDSSASDAGVTGTLGAAADSARAGAKQGVLEETKDDAKAQAKKAIGKLFGRPPA